MEGGPSPERTDKTRAAVREGVVAARPAGTSRTYGKDDCSDGPKRQWKHWCEATGGSELDGMTIPVDKEVYSILVTPAKVEEYLQNHLTRRALMNAQRETLGNGTTLGIKSLKKHLDALNDLYGHQRTDPLTKDDMQNVMKPRSSETVRSIILTAQRKTATRHQEMYLDRGKGATLMEGYTDDQHTQLSRYGPAPRAQPHPPRRARPRAGGEEPQAGPRRRRDPPGQEVRARRPTTSSLLLTGVSPELRKGPTRGGRLQR